MQELNATRRCQLVMSSTRDKSQWSKLDDSVRSALDALVPSFVDSHESLSVESIPQRT